MSGGDGRGTDHRGESSDVDFDASLWHEGRFWASDKGIDSEDVFFDANPPTPDWIDSSEDGTPIEGRYGTLYLKDDGTWTYVLDDRNEEISNLPNGTELTETFVIQAVVQVEGGIDVSTIRTLTISITAGGANNNNDVTLTVPSSDDYDIVRDEAGDTASGQVSGSDADNTPISFQAYPVLDPTTEDFDAPTRSVSQAGIDSTPIDSAQRAIEDGGVTITIYIDFTADNSAENAVLFEAGGKGDSQGDNESGLLLIQDGNRIKWT